MSELKDLLKTRIRSLTDSLKEIAKSSGRQGVQMAAEVSSHIAAATAAGAADLEKIIDHEERTASAFAARQATEAADAVDQQIAESVQLFIESVAIAAIAAL